MDDSQNHACGFAPVGRTEVCEAPVQEESASPAPKKGWLGAAAVILSVWALLLLAVASAPPPGTLDDAFVVLVEARGPVPWHVDSPDMIGASGYGGQPRVESATSLLDVAVRSFARTALPQADPLRMAGWLGLGWLAVLVGGTAVVVLRWTRSLAAASVTGALMALAPGLVESAGYLLEGPLFALLWAGSCMAAIGQHRAVTWSLGLLLAACRPEGMALAPLACAFAFRQELASRPFAWPGVLRGALLGLAPALALTSFRWLRFGAPVPNTFYAKASDSRWIEVQDGARYLVEALSGPEGAAVLVLAAVCAAVGVLRLRSSCALALLAGSVACAAIVALSGGDSYPGRRLFFPVGIPLILSAGVLWGIARGWEKVATVLGSVVALGLLALPLVRGSSSVPALSSPADALQRGWLALASGPVGMEAFEGDAEVFGAVSDALGTEETFAHLHVQRYRWFEPSARILDMTGLTDSEIARLPAPGSVLFGRAAIDVAVDRAVGAIHLDPMRARPSSWVDAHDLQSALSDPSVAVRYLGEPFLSVELAEKIAEVYVPASRVLPGGGGVFNLAVRADLAERFRTQGFRVGAR